MSSNFYREGCLYTGPSIPLLIHEWYCIVNISVYTCSVVLKKGFLIIILTNLIVLILEWHGFFLSFNQVLEDISWYFAWMPMTVRLF